MQVDLVGDPDAVQRIYDAIVAADEATGTKKPTRLQREIQLKQAQSGGRLARGGVEGGWQSLATQPNAGEPNPKSRLVIFEQMHWLFDLPPFDVHCPCLTPKCRRCFFFADTRRRIQFRRWGLE